MPVIIESLRQKQKRQRERIHAQLQDDAGPTAVRVANGTAVEDVWRDPDDQRPNQREPRQVRGHRNCDEVVYMLRCGTLSFQQARAARRLRDHYERAQQTGSVAGCDPSERGGGVPSGLTPSEARLDAIKALREARAVVGAHSWLIIDKVVLQNIRFSHVTGPNRATYYKALRHLTEGLDALAEHFDAEWKQFRREVGDPASAPA
jgi:hypothetical protein